MSIYCVGRVQKSQIRSYSNLWIRHLLKEEKHFNETLYVKNELKKKKNRLNETQYIKEKGCDEILFWSNIDRI